MNITDTQSYLVVDLHPVSSIVMVEVKNHHRKSPQSPICGSQRLFLLVKASVRQSIKHVECKIIITKKHKKNG
ncbi:hypothetical protein HanXRQr2_Chr02g0062091 [Helianthus annuus]|uniref:Uncharacterized protein n=1 Tax=Helianthus annuus TaxID=4232 RepID=A0A9K3JNK2_HELAN|nr:hypothetical protein HanXRQr2_Chr02g0062091 [Helianthus annuus]KAJ0951527.1 hypothetical protein HanPSC8_Chr02g0061121 [Helianthus annuus]